MTPASPEDQKGVTEESDKAPEQPVEPAALENSISEVSLSVSELNGSERIGSEAEAQPDIAVYSPSNSTASQPPIPTVFGIPNTHSPGMWIAYFWGFILLVFIVY